MAIWGYSLWIFFTLWNMAGVIILNRSPINRSFSMAMMAMWSTAPGLGSCAEHPSKPRGNFWAEKPWEIEYGYTWDKQGITALRRVWVFYNCALGDWIKNHHFILQFTVFYAFDLWCFEVCFKMSKCQKKTLGIPQHLLEVGWSAFFSVLFQSAFFVLKSLPKAWMYWCWCANLNCHDLT